MPNLILFGGSFDPIHLGHLQIANVALAEVPAEKLLFIPCKFPVHKAPTHANTIDRLNMLKLAIGGYEHFEISDIEISNDRPSYTVDTLAKIQTLYPQHQLFFLIGTDSLQQFETWHRYETILQRCNLIAVERPQHSIDSTLLSHFNCFKKYQEMSVNKTGQILFLQGNIPDISSTELRMNLTRQKELGNLLPKAVADYIEAKKLYQ